MDERRTEIVARKAIELYGDQALDSVKESLGNALLDDDERMKGLCQGKQF